MITRRSGLMMSLLAMGIMGNATSNGALKSSSGRPFEPEPTSVDPKKQQEQALRKGLKRFNIDGKEIWALNEKNAIRKAAKS